MDSAFPPCARRPVSFRSIQGLSALRVLSLIHHQLVPPSSIISIISQVLYLLAYESSHLAPGAASSVWTRSTPYVFLPLLRSSSPARLSPFLTSYSVFRPISYPTYVFPTASISRINIIVLLQSKYLKLYMHYYIWHCTQAHLIMKTL